MIPNQTLVDFPEFADSGTKTAPGSAKYSAGFQEADVLPAEWLNYFENKSSAGITALNDGVKSCEAELNNVVTAGGETPDKDTNNQVLTAINYLIAQAKSEAIDAAYPVGCIYTQYPNQEAPANLWPGTTWTELDYSGAFFRASGGNAAAFISGGTLTPQADATAVNGLSVASIVTDPGHTHTQTARNGNSWNGGNARGNGDQVGSYDTLTSQISTLSATTGISVTSSVNSSDTETRPTNFTVKIWKRTA